MVLLFKITSSEIKLAIVFAGLGFIFSSRSWLLWLNSFDPIKGLFIYYIILYISIFILSKFNLIIYKFRIEKPLQVLGLLLITFAFFILVDWESAYVQYITTGSTEGASVIFYQCEDGATWYFWYNVMNVKNIEMARILTYVITPFVLVLIGSYFVSKPTIW